MPIYFNNEGDLTETQYRNKCTAAMKWIDTPENKRDTSFDKLNDPGAGDSKGATSWILKTVIKRKDYVFNYVFKISKKKSEYKKSNEKLVNHLKTLFEYASTLGNAILVPYFAKIHDNGGYRTKATEGRLCLVYELCSTITDNQNDNKGKIENNCVLFDKQKRLFNVIKQLHMVQGVDGVNSFVGFDIKADNLLNCSRQDDEDGFLFQLNDYENCISDLYYDEESPDISANFNVMWKGWEDDNGETVNGLTVKRNFDKYKYYYMALDYIAFFSMITNFKFQIGNYINDNQIEEVKTQIDNLKNAKAKKSINRLKAIEEKYDSDEDYTNKDKEKVKDLKENIKSYKRLKRLKVCHVNILQHLLELMKDPMYVENILNMDFDNLIDGVFRDARTYNRIRSHLLDNLKLRF